MTEFEGVAPALGQALIKRGYSHLTPVQKSVLAPKLNNADLLVSAQTGSGKTVAFGLAFANTLLDGADRLAAVTAPLALVVAPTRELALQVMRELEWLYEKTGAAVASCVGGMDMRTERRALARGAHIVVGTPGRLRDHIQRNSLDTSALKAVVLDEADEMLDLGFREDLEFILDAAPAERRTLMFSATVPRSIAALAKRYQRDAVRVTTLEEQAQHLDIEYRALTVAPRDSENAIINVLRYFEAKNALVFCGTRATTNHMTSRFNNRGFSVVALSGELSQKERSHALQAMRDGRARVCIATDVAARGIDLPNLELVIHADLPKNRESLLHRSGRTGRAGRKGVSVLIVPHNAGKRTDRLLNSAGVKAEWAKPPSVEDVMRRDDERILADPVLNDPLHDNERDFAQKLLDHHGAEQIAAAFIRLYRAGKSAPEELLNVAPDRQARQHERNPRQKGREPRQHRDSQQSDFQDSVWFSLSVGRKQSAEPRWLLPMLCKTGNLTKGDIGAIRIQQNETHVEMASSSVEQFLQAVGPDHTLEKTIRVTRLKIAPETFEGTREEPGRERSSSGAEMGGEMSGGERSPNKTRKKPKGKGKHKRQLAKARGKDSGPGKPRTNTAKRKKPSQDRPDR